MSAYEALAASYDRLTNDVDYGATVAFYREILMQEGPLIWLAAQGRSAYCSPGRGCGLPVWTCLRKC